MSKCCKPKNPLALTTQKMNRRIVIEHFRTTTDNEGIATKGWEPLVRLWASRKPITERWREFFQAAGVNAEKVFQYSVRHREGVADESMRLFDKGRHYEIKAVLDDVFGDRTETWIMAMELTDG